LCRGVVGAAVACALLAPAAGAAPSEPRDTGIVDVSNTPGESEGEEPMSVNPANPLQITTVANHFSPNMPAPLERYFGKGGVQDTRLYSSRDGGRTWTTHALGQGGLGPIAPPLPPLLGFSIEFSDALNILGTDADVAWDREGNAYYEYGDVHGINRGAQEVVPVYKSVNGGVTWNPRHGIQAINATAEGKEGDRPWFAIDNSGGARDGRIYMTWETTPFADVPPEVYLVHSDDEGATWTFPSRRVDDGTYQTQFNPRARPVVGADGILYVIYDRAAPAVTPHTGADQGGVIQVAVARSKDGGQTFDRFVADDDVHRVSSPDEATTAYTEMIGAIAADPKNSGRVAVAWPERIDADNSRIILRYSTDGGEHWSKRVDVADDAASKPNQHDHVTLAWLRDGRLFVGWRDRRCCGGAWTDKYEQWVRVLAPGSAGELVPGRVVEFTAEPDPPNTGGRGDLTPDEFQGLIATDIGVGLSWAKRTGTYNDLTFRRIPLAAFEQPCVDRRRFAFKLHPPPGHRIVRASAYVDDIRVKTVRGRSLRRLAIDPLPRGRYVVRIVTRTNRGVRLISTRVYVDCIKGPPRTIVRRPGRRP
jgi:hypothetical protein